MRRLSERTSLTRRWFRVITTWCAALLVLCLLPLRAARASGYHRAAVDAPVIGDSRLQLPELPRGFDTHETEWLHLAYPTSLSYWVTPLVEEANHFRTFVRERLGRDALRQVSIRLASETGEMARLAPENAPYPKYAVGVAYSREGLILLSNEPVHPNSEHDLRAVLRHELAHVALHDAVQGHHVPLWFNEGLAIHLARENTFARIRTLWTATVAGNLIELRELDRRFPRDIVGVPLAYAQSADVVRYLLRQQDAERFDLLIQRVGRGQEFERALYDSYGMDVYNLERNWRMDVEDRYSLWPVLLSGTLIWGGAIVLVTVAWRRKRKRQRIVLRRWAMEEAEEDARAAQARQRQEQLRDEAQAVLLPGPGNDPVGGGPHPIAIPPRESLVPKVRHDGTWHTLH